MTAYCQSAEDTEVIAANQNTPNSHCVLLENNELNDTGSCDQQSLNNYNYW